MSPRFPMGVATTYNPVGNAAARPSAAGEPESPLLPSPFERFNAFLLAAFLAAPPAFSADPPRETTLPSGFAPSTVVTPLRDSQAAPAPLAPLPAQPGRAPIPAGPAPHVALILPVSSPTLGRLADAVRQGFLAAVEVAGRNALPVRFYAAVDDGPAVLELCRMAQKEGAVLVVAGLTRDGAAGLAKSDCPRQPTLVLNQPPEDARPANMYSISLAAEQEARQAALMAINDGWRAAIVIASPSPLARRVAEGFEREWGRAAGEVRRGAFSGNPEEAPASKERIAALNADMVFLALDQDATRAVRPYISGTLPIYTTSLGVDPRAEASVNVDLEGVRYVDMPWFVQPDHPAVMIYPPPKAPMAVEQERLYALGIDAYRLCGLLLQSEPKTFSLDGVTGRITLDADRHFARTLVPTGFDAGRAVPLHAAQ
jgi:outer membrane PBP1 activator LpoA protein